MVIGFKIKLLNKDGSEMDNPSPDVIKWLKEVNDVFDDRVTLYHYPEFGLSFTTVDYS